MLDKYIGTEYEFIIRDIVEDFSSEEIDEMVEEFSPKELENFLRNMFELDTKYECMSGLELLAD